MVRVSFFAQLYGPADFCDKNFQVETVCVTKFVRILRATRAFRAPAICTEAFRQLVGPCRTMSYRVVACRGSVGLVTVESTPSDWLEGFAAALAPRLHATVETAWFAQPKKVAKSSR